MKLNIVKRIAQKIKKILKTDKVYRDADEDMDRDNMLNSKFHQEIEENRSNEALEIMLAEILATVPSSVEQKEINIKLGLRSTRVVTGCQQAGPQVG